MRYKAHFLLISHVEQQKLLLQNTKPVLYIQGLGCPCESERVGLEEILVRGGSLRTAGTAPFPPMTLWTPRVKPATTCAISSMGRADSRRATISSAIIFV